MKIVRNISCYLTSECMVVEGLNVINDPKCNKVLNVITFCPKCNKVLNVITLCPKCNNSNYSNKCHPQISAALVRGVISTAALIRLNLVHFLMHCENELLVNDKVTVFF